MVTIRRTHPTYLVVWRQGLPVRRQSRTCIRPLNCILKDYARMGCLYLNRPPLQSMWLCDSGKFISEGHLIISCQRTRGRYLCKLIREGVTGTFLSYLRKLFSKWFLAKH